MLKKVILADDEARWRLLVHDYLEQDGCTVLEAENGERRFLCCAGTRIRSW